MFASLSRFNRRVAALFAGRRLTSSRIVTGIEEEARSSVRADRPNVVTKFPDLITPLATSYAGVWAMPRLVARASKSFRTLREALPSARTSFDLSILVARMLLADRDLPELEKEYKKVISGRHTREAAVRAQHLWGWVYVLSLVTVAVVDWQFFYFLLMDVQNASPSSPNYGMLALQSGAIASITPLAVIIVSEVGGRRLARFRVEVRDLFDRRKEQDADTTPTLIPWSRLLSLAGTPTLIVIALAVLVGFFAFFAHHRFSGLSQQVGATSAADPALLSWLIAMLPVLSFLAALFHHDIPTRHSVTIIRAWKKIQDQMAANQRAVAAAMLAWINAWDALNDKVSAIVAEAQVSVQTVEHLLLMGLARTNQRGETAFTLEAVRKPQEPSSPTLRLKEALTSLAATGKFLVTVPEPITATTFSSAGWVTTELEINLQWLVHYLPAHDERVDARVQLLLNLAQPNTPAIPETDQSPDVDTNAAGNREADGKRGSEPLTPPPSDTFDTAELDKLLDPPLTTENL